MDKPVVFVVDDDEAVRRSLSWLIRSVDLQVETFASARDFLDSHPNSQSGCLVADVRMPEMSGLELQNELTGRGTDLPVILITGHGDVQMAVRALKAGAFDFVEKPFSDQLLLDRIHEAVEYSLHHRERRSHEAEVRACMEALTPRECEVLEQVVAGEPNKRIAFLLGLSEKTVEFHRAHVMEKMKATSLADLIKKVLTVREDWGNP